MNIVRNVRRQVAGFSLATLIASFFAIGVAQAQTFPDVSPDQWFSSYVEQLVADGTVNGSMDLYRPADNVNRAEMAKLVVEAFDLALEDPATPTLKDVEKDAWYYTYVETAAANGVVGGYKDTNGALTGYYGPGDNVTREQASKMIVLGAPMATNTVCGPSFFDVPVSAWSYSYVETLYANSVIDGYSDGSFGPTNKINRAEVAKVVSNGMSPMLRPCGGFNVSDATATSDVTVDVCFNSEYDETSAMMAENYSVMDLDSADLAVSAVAATSDPMCVELTTAAQTSGTNYDLLVSNVTSMDAMGLEVNSTSFTGYTVGALGSGDLTVELNAASPSGVTLPSGATSVKMVTWNFTAGAEDAVLKSLIVHRFGVSALPGDNQVYLYEGNDRLTSGKAVNGTTNLATFNNLNLAIAAGKTKTLTLRMDTGTVAATGEVGFELTNADAVNADAGTVTGSFPVQGDLFGLSTTAAGKITVTKNGTITNPKVGEDDVTIAKFKATTTDEAASLEQMNVYVTGTVTNDAVENFELYVSGTTDPIATVAGLNSNDLATFVLDTPYSIAKGDTKSFTVKADFNTGRSADTVNVYFDETTDVLAIGGTYGFGMTVDLNDATGYDGTACTAAGAYADCSNSTLEGGDVTISSGGPSAGDVPIAGDDVHLLDFTIVTASSVTFKNFPVSLTASESAADTKEGLLNATASNFTDIKVIDRDTNETLWGPVDANVFTTALGGAEAILEAAGDNAIAYYLFADEIDFAAGGEKNLAITADIANTTTLDAMTVVAGIATAASASSYPEIRDVNNKVVTNSSSLVPNTVITGKTMTVSTPSLALSLASVPVTATTYVKGQKAVKFTGINAACGAASDCLVTDAALTGYIDDDGVGTGADVLLAGQDTTSTNDVYLNSIVGSVWLVDSADNVVATSKSIQTDGTITFDNMTWTLDAGASEVFYVVGDVSSDAFKNANGESVAFSIAAAGLSYEDDDGNSRTSTGAVNAAQATYMSISGGGSLTIAVDPSTPREDLAVAGTAGVETSKFKFTTTDEAFLVKKLALNARQSAVTTAALGDYDHNISGIKIEYTNSLGAAESKTATLTDGIANFSGMDMLIDKDDDAVMMVSTTLNTISGGATAGEYIDLNVAFNNFEAVAQASGETYKGDKIDSDVAAASDLDFGTITWTDNGALDVNLAVAALAGLGSAQELKVDNAGAATPVNLPVGTLLCVSADTTCDQTTESVMVVTGWTEGTAWTDGVTGDTVATLVLNNDDTAFANNDNIVYSLPGTGYLTAANRLHLYKTKPTLALGSGVPSAAGTPTDTIMYLSVAANAAEDVIIRQGLAGDDENDVDDVAGAIADDEALIVSTAGDYVDGAGGIRIIETTGTGVDGIFLLDETYASGAINGNDYVSFWMKIDEVDNDSDVDFADISLVLDDDVTPDAATAVSLGSTTLAWANGVQVTAGQEFTDDTWVLFTVSIAAAAVDADDQVGFAVVESTEIDASDEIYVDGLVFHNEALRLDLAGNASFDITPSDAVDCSLKDGSTTVAIGSAGLATTSAAKVLFVPTDEISGTDYPEIVINGSKNFSVVCDAAALVTQTVNNDKLTPSVATGTSVEGTVTRGGFWWSADETTNVLVYWLGNVTDKISGTTLNY